MIKLTYSIHEQNTWNLRGMNDTCVWFAYARNGSVDEGLRVSL